MKEFEVESEEYAPTNDVVKYCADNDLILVRLPDNIISLDLDTDDQVYRFLKLFPLFSKQLNLEHIGATISKSGKGKHIYIRTKNPVQPFERVAIQACLGSDPKREMISVRRLQQGVPNYSQMFETPEQAEKHMDWMLEAGLELK